MRSAVSALLERVPVGPLATVRRFTQDPVGTQERLLRDLLTRAADTEWGRRYGFAEIVRERDVVQAYQERVPLHTYDDLRESAERVRQGAADVIWPGTFHHFAVSSGTASAGKVIPVSARMLEHNRQFSVGAGLHYLAEKGDARFLLGKHLSLPGRIEPDPKAPERNALVGEVSGLLAEFSPAFIRLLYQAVPGEVFNRPNWEAKLHEIVRRTVTQDVRLVAMAPTWSLVLFRLLIEAHNKRTGGRATTVGEVWPNLQVFFSGGVALASYKTLIEEQVGLPDLDFVENYGASEGFIAFQNRLDDPAMLVHLDNGVFFEFVRMDELHGDHPRRYTIADVEPGVRYAPYLSTCSGLWAYQLGDVVRFTETFPHKILVAGRTSEMLDTYGEAVFGEEARAAVRQACKATGARMLDFHVAPRPANRDEVPGHQWLVEFEELPDDLQAFSQAIDAYLQEVNRHYQIRREAQAFKAPEVVPVERGAFYRWLQATRDAVSGQTKVPRMSEDRDVADGILAHAGNTL